MVVPLAVRTPPGSEPWIWMPCWRSPVLTMDWLFQSACAAGAAPSAPSAMASVVRRRGAALTMRDRDMFIGCQVESRRPPCPHRDGTGKNGRSKSTNNAIQNRCNARYLSCYSDVSSMAGGKFSCPRCVP
ncbi:Uncharacterised protein [Bordetella pertussis]|nr:Uncharacterised protein [Bordetella pertussis]CFW43295.1 Uncharacterised protein [Bordetella pertussis]